eukprot:m.85064 g.85064  ORF g.85064 m.85064 type:complete len:476 (-) comp25827_c0_seq2:83-1510(-)
MLGRWTIVNDVRAMIASRKPPLSQLRRSCLTAAVPATAAPATPTVLEYNAAEGRLDLELAHGCSPLTFNTSWLRHNCTHLTDANSGQKLGDVSMLEPPCTIENVSFDNEGSLRIKWEADGHVSEYTRKWLKNQMQPPPEAQMPTPYGLKTPKSLDFEFVTTTQQGLWQWLDMLRTDGICLLKNAGNKTGTVVKLANLISNPQVTMYGETFDVVSTKNPINVAYSNVGLALHQDLVYYESPPGLQFLHAIEFEPCVHGGESTLLDCAPLIEKFRADHPQHFATLCRIPTRFQKVHFDRDDPVDVVYHIPIITQNSSGKIIRFTWAPQFEGPLPATYDSADIAAYYSAYCALAKEINTSSDKLEFRLQIGDVITFNNRRVLHGRNAFSGEGNAQHSRHLQGTYVNIDDFRSKHRVLARLFASNPNTHDNDDNTNIHDNDDDNNTTHDTDNNTIDNDDNIDGDGAHTFPHVWNSDHLS